MKKKFAAVALVATAVLAGCTDTSVHHERIDGRDCLVRRHGINGRVVALSCDWEGHGS